LEDIGIDGQRLQMTNISAAMGSQFVISATEFTEQIIAIGPNPLQNESD
jgi:coenzyme F420-reducing hydrogenase delta subunit